ncbi:carbohydrate ABC transporter permease [Paenibacillus cellulositrophicus]|jgi:putative aldouronate transport system permease protein|uniref:Sugar ABC transporter permease n=3 Tax=Paenibacillus TaxID=44249 RepID=A0A1R1EZL0_9BACL|nr:MULTISPECIES: carbohydrate ABC transporter permease [Paenibacillus]MBJ9990744.1 carbohydrate ABC transporter permease [Paenibacillus sp. S28]MEC0177019.1 carbohydrate ABC transporter permease [Paenibacillus favisporus]OMF57263.1 sugar ABC transporter permease [Paenibacillus rhizosphaerae]OXL84049.1 sugar ABC transporter permease [Paenibacillus sp. SSG-1]PQP88462.1 carbohydrate ABC transporter permease [Paenibacillus sp. AR247]
MGERRLTPADKMYATLNYSVLLLFCATALYPFIYFLALSFNDGYDAMKGGIYLFPRVFTLENYAKAFSNPLILNSFYISISRTLIVTVGSVFLTALLAYALSRKGLPGRKYIVFFFFFTTLFSGGLIPTFILYRELHILNTFWVLVLPSLYNFFNAIIMKTFFDGIPEGLSESARIDGASELAVFARIILPLSMPVLATIALFVGVGVWNDWFTGQFFIQNEKLQPAATFLNKMISEASFQSMTSSGNSGSAIQNMTQSQMELRGVTPEALRMTFVIIITTPIICVYPFLQKYFVKGVLVGSLKE